MAAVKPPPTKVKAPPFEILKGSEIWRPRPPLEYIVDGFLPVGCLGMFCALGASHKSWMLVDMALAVAKGRPWLQTFTTGRPRRVLYLDYENNEDETARRIIGLEQTPIENFHMSIMPDLFLTDKKFLPEIESLVHHYDFIAIDSLSGGSQDISESDPKFAQSLRHMKRAAAKSGAGFVVLHHSRKPSRGRDGEEVEETNKRNKPRGTTAIFNATDALLDVESINDNESRVTHTKKRGPRRLEPFIIRIDGIAPAPTSLYVMTEKQIADEKNRIRLKNILARYAKILAGKAMSATDLIQMSKRRKQDGLAELRELVKAGLLRLSQNLYSLVPEGGPKKGGSGTGKGTNVVPITKNTGNRSET